MAVVQTVKSLSCPTAFANTKMLTRAPGAWLQGTADVLRIAGADNSARLLLQELRRVLAARTEAVIAAAGAGGSFEGVMERLAQALHSGGEEVLQSLSAHTNWRQQVRWGPQETSMFLGPFVNTFSFYARDQRCVHIVAAF